MGGVFGEALMVDDVIAKGKRLEKRIVLVLIPYGLQCPEKVEVVEDRNAFVVLVEGTKDKDKKFLQGKPKFRPSFHQVCNAKLVLEKRREDFSKNGSDDDDSSMSLNSEDGIWHMAGCGKFERDCSKKEDNKNVA
ncbi:hypothetical protein Q3G72_026590 [Acer saccharum]|nr:hypothetical protein Q3G72_026590 [Acer saccharum]